MLKYITLKEALEIHKLTIEYSDGGLTNALNIGQLDSILSHIQNDEYYPTFTDKITHLLFSVCKFHTFEDGNKRLALTLSLQFLLINGYDYLASRFMTDYENITYHVANGNISKELLNEILKSSFDGTFESEEIKIKILNAISLKQTKPSYIDR